MSTVSIGHLYEDYLLSVPVIVSAVDLSEIANNAHSHDQISRMLYSGKIDDRQLYLKGKRFIKSLKTEGEKVVIIDDSIVAKPHSSVNGLVCYHYDHSQHGYVKGINFISAVWADENHTVSLSMEVVKKEPVWDEQKGEAVWKTAEPKNAVFQQMVSRLTHNRQIEYVLADIWYGSVENMKHIVEECETNFVLAIKSNWLVATSEKAGEYKPLEGLKLGKRAVKLYLNGLEFPVLVVGQVFKNHRWD